MTKTIYIDKGKKKLNILVEDSLTCLIVGTGSGEKEITFELKKKGANLKVLGLFLLGNGEIKLRTIQKHLARNTVSDLKIKSVLFDQGKFDYLGRVNIFESGQQSNAYQQNDNLLLGDGEVETTPELEILADDVKCSHGSTTSQLNERDLFYLKTRGLDQNEAKKLFVQGFLATITDKIDNIKITKEIELCLKKLLKPKI